MQRRADGSPIQEDLFHERFVIPDYWAYVIFVRMRIIANAADPLLEGEWTEWTPHWAKPNHFRTEAGANRMYAERVGQEARKIEMGLLEMKVEPKYIGCKPDQDEAWIAD